MCVASCRLMIESDAPVSSTACEVVDKKAAVASLIVASSGVACTQSRRDRKSSTVCSGDVPMLGAGGSFHGICCPRVLGGTEPPFRARTSYRRFLSDLAMVLSTLWNGASTLKLCFAKSSGSPNAFALIV